jgi:hypothetical protein
MKNGKRIGDLPKYIDIEIEQRKYRIFIETAKDKKCFKCGSLGHIAKYCKTKSENIKNKNLEELTLKVRKNNSNVRTKRKNNNNKN